MNKILLVLSNLVILSSLYLYSMEKSSSDVQIINNTGENFYIHLTSPAYVTKNEAPILESSIVVDATEPKGRSLKPGGTFNITNYSNENSIQGNFQDKVLANKFDLKIISNEPEAQKALRLPGTIVITLKRQLSAPWIGTPIKEFVVEAQAVPTPLQELIRLEKGEKITQEPEYKESIARMLEQLKRAGQKIDPRIQEAAREPFIIAIKKQDENAVIAFLQAGIDPNFTDSSGQTPLMIAVNYDNLSIIEELLRAQADVNALDPLGRSALSLISKKSSPTALKIAQRLIKAGANV